MEEPIETNLPNDLVDASVDIELGKKKLEENTEIEVDQNGNEVKVLYFDSNYNITTKDKAIYKKSEKI